MRVLQIIHDRERGGVQTLARLIETGLLPHAFMFETAYLYPRHGLSSWAKLRHAIQMVQHIWHRDYDALIAYQATAAVLVAIVGALAGCRIRVVHQTSTPAETAWPSRLLDKCAGTLGLYTINIANSAATMAEYKNYPAAYRRTMTVIEHGLDAPSPTRTREETRRRFALPLDQPLILNVGRLAGQKNQDLLIRVLACQTDAHLALAGAGPNEAALRSLAATLGVTERLHMLGPLASSDVADLYLGADLFVFPSVWETFGLAAVEAAMVGLPMVVADLPVLREVLHVDGSEPVTFVAPDDLNGWIAAIGRALASPPPPRVVTMFARGMRRKYSRERMIESYRTVLDRPTQQRDLDREEDLQSAAKEVQS